LSPALVKPVSNCIAPAWAHCNLVCATPFEFLQLLSVVVLIDRVVSRMIITL
jgi:hypothetical protein